MKLRDLLLLTHNQAEIDNLKLLEGVSLDDEVEEPVVKNDANAYCYRYMLFSYNTSNFRLTNESTKEDNFLL
ncbi:MAG: hypothetical protein ACHQIM_22215, partial [Sphingobacteriales bacterium]